MGCWDVFCFLCGNPCHDFFSVDDVDNVIENLENYEKYKNKRGYEGLIA